MRKRYNALLAAACVKNDKHPTFTILAIIEMCSTCTLVCRLCLLIAHYIILPCSSYKKCMQVEIIRFETQPESLREVSVATRKAGRATDEVWNSI